MNNKYTSYLPVLVLGCGGIGGALWALMQRFCQDDKELLIPWNLPGILLFLLTAAVVMATLLLIRPLGGSNRYGDNFVPSPVGCIAAFAAAGGILVLILRNLHTYRDPLSGMWLATGALSVPAMILTGLNRRKGKRPNFLLHSIICVFFGIHMANQYRVWSGSPEILDFSYQLFACVGLAMTAYYHAAFEVGMGRRMRMLPVGLLTTYFCLVCIGSEGFGLFYLTCGLWAAANLCGITPKPRRPKPGAEPSAEDIPPAPEAQV